MSLPVSFKEFGSPNETLYSEYCCAYREALAVLRITADQNVARGGSGVGVAGGNDVFRGYALGRGLGGRVGGGRPFKCTLPWRGAGPFGGATAIRGGGDVGRVEGSVADASVAGDATAAEKFGEDGGSDLRRGVDACGGDRLPGDGEPDGQACGVRSGSGAGGGSTGLVSVIRGKNYSRNRARREKAKALRSTRGVVAPSLVSVRAAHPRLDDTWAQRKIRENEVATAKLEVQLAKIKREAEDGTAEKRYKVEANLVQGQLDGKFALVPQQRVVSWAKTVASGSGGGSSSAGGKTVASISSVSGGPGGSSVTTASLEATIASLKKQLSGAHQHIRDVQAEEMKKREDLRNGCDRLIRDLEIKHARSLAGRSGFN